MDWEQEVYKRPGQKIIKGDRISIVCRLYKNQMFGIDKVWSGANLVISICGMTSILHMISTCYGALD